jgi:PAS domain S-box-containing protein
MARLVQELQIHQVELELQNEELKKARDEAEAERERYLDLYDFAPVGYFALDPEGVIRQVNLAGARLLGLERSLLLNRRFGKFVSPADLPVFNAFLKKVSRTGAGVRRFPGRSGINASMSASRRPLTGTGGSAGRWRWT